MASEPAFDPYAVLQVVPDCEQEVVHAAYRALARTYHPDRDPTRRAADKMAELNRAYSLVREAGARSAFDRSRRRTIAGVSVAAGPGAPAGAAATASRSSSGSVLGFGRYEGWALRDIARHDREYLVWLSRHSSGIRYRTEIYSILGAMGRPAA